VELDTEREGESGRSGVIIFTVGKILPLICSTVTRIDAEAFLS
jgi:hypothetical protein